MVYLKSIRNAIRVNLPVLVMLIFISLIFTSCKPAITGVPDFKTNLQAGQSHIPKPTGDQRYRVDMLTIEPGAEIYSAWGHTALRILDTKRNVDAVFDYGLFDFSSDFAIRFLQGQPAFMVGAYRFDQTLRRYANDNRRIFAQQIYLNDAEAAQLWNVMMINTLPQNRTFQYHHYLDNCTTRVRDRIDVALGGLIKPQFTGQTMDSSFRRSSMGLLTGKPFLWSGTNFILGSTIDRPVDEWEHQYLPLNFMNGLEAFRAAGHTDLVGPIEVVLEPVAGGFQIDRSGWFYFIGFYILIIGLFFVYPVVQTSGNLSKWTGRIAWFGWNTIAGFAGLILAVTWAFTNHDTVYSNINLLGFSPVLLLVIPLGLYFRRKKQYKSNIMMHRYLIAPPLVGLLMSLLGLMPQFCWPFLLTAVIIQGLLYLRFLLRVV